MAFQAMMSGAECSTSNSALGQFMKHTQDDRSLQQDRVGPAWSGAAGSSSFRSTGPTGPMSAGPNAQGSSNMEFFSQGRPGALADGAFDLGQLHGSLDQIPFGGPLVNMEAAFRASQPPMSAAAGPATQMPLGWQEQFHQSRASGPVPPQAAPTHTQHRPMDMGRGMGSMGMMGRPMMSSARRLGGVGASLAEQPKLSEDQRFSELSDEKWEAEFAKYAPTHDEPQADTKGKGKATEEESATREAETPLQNARLEVPEEQPSWLDAMGPTPAELCSHEEFLDQQRNLAPTEEFMERIMRMDRADIANEEALLSNLDRLDSQGYPNPGEYKMQANNVFVTHHDPLKEGLWLQSQGGSLSDATLLFEAAVQQRSTDSHSNFERSEAWRRLGEAHAMNEMETSAIRALERALEIDENNLEVYIPLAVSYMNEGFDMASWQTLKRYINKGYPHLKSKPMDPSPFDPLEGPAELAPWSALNETTDLFLQAAREGAAKGIMDPEVQIGLGVLFFSDQSYSQAKDCFQAALSVQPDDVLLWNRLGAVLASSGKSEEAISAYHRALELRPTFTRAIYNLSVSCLKLGAHHEAAEHLLAAIALQRNLVIPIPEGAEHSPGVFHRPDDSDESQNLWSTLRGIFVGMERLDLASKAHAGTSLDEFKSLGFDF